MDKFPIIQASVPTVYRTAKYNTQKEGETYVCCYLYPTSEGCLETKFGQYGNNAIEAVYNMLIYLIEKEYIKTKHV